MVQSIQEQAIGSDEETVLWAIQPVGVTLYVMESGSRYRVRNRSEVVVIKQADRPELERLGYIAPKGV